MTNTAFHHSRHGAEGSNWCLAEWSLLSELTMYKKCQEDSAAVWYSWTPSNLFGILRMFWIVKLIREKKCNHFCYCKFARDVTPLKHLRTPCVILSHQCWALSRRTLDEPHKDAPGDLIWSLAHVLRPLITQHSGHNLPMKRRNIIRLDFTYSLSELNR